MNEPAGQDANGLSPQRWFFPRWSGPESGSHQLTRGSLSQRFEWFHRYTRLSRGLPFVRSMLRGRQQVGYPVAALKSRRFMEVPRHVIAQRVVAGTHITPFGSRNWGGVSPFGTGVPGQGQGPVYAPMASPMSPPMPSMAPPMPPPYSPGMSPPVPSPGTWSPTLSPEGIDLDPLGFLVELTK